MGTSVLKEIYLLGATNFPLAYNVYIIYIYNVQYQVNRSPDLWVLIVFICFWNNCYSFMVNSSWSLSMSSELSLAWLGVMQGLSSSVGEMGDVGDIEESSDTDVTELFDLSTCQWLPLPSVSSDPRDMSAIIPLSVKK